MFKTHSQALPKIKVVFFGDACDFDEFRKAILAINYQRKEKGKRAFSYSMKKAGHNVPLIRIKKRNRRYP